jgi:cytochrome c oxidase subunit 2
MYAPVKVVEPAQFEDWLAGKAVEAPPAGEMTTAEKGAQVSQETGCLSCHSVDGSQMVGPTWLGLFGSQVPLEDGSTVTADEPYLRSSILEPTTQVVQGYPNIMPAAYALLPEEDLAAIIEYIKSLSQ